MIDVISRVNDGTHMFWCPGCKCAHGFNGGWTFNGDFVRPTVSPSILVRCNMSNPAESTRCHIFVRDGKIQFLNDCTHELAGKTVPMEPLWGAAMIDVLAPATLPGERRLEWRRLVRLHSTARRMILRWRV